MTSVTLPEPILLQQNWQTILANCIEDPAELIEFLQLPEQLLPAAVKSSELFPLRAPRPFLEKIQKGDCNDPLLLQILPALAEQHEVEGFSTDPLSEVTSNPCEGLIHKYKGRLLLVLTSACAINCRYCFRRHFPYQENRLGPEQWQKVVDYIQQDKSISEVIFSGGDPLATSDQRLAKLIGELENIPHLKRLRIHSRLPVVIPQRITDNLCNLLQKSRFQTVMVLHSNHANEIDDSLRQGVERLKQSGVTVLNQAVLLRGINDDLDSQIALSEKLFQAGILPYYLFALDKVQGAAHFDHDDTFAGSLLSQLQHNLPGYLVPKLVREIAGEGSKTLLPPL